jgi:hypothetical protein
VPAAKGRRPVSEERVISTVTLDDGSVFEERESIGPDGRPVRHRYQTSPPTRGFLQEDDPLPKDVLDTMGYLEGKDRQIRRLKRALKRLLYAQGELHRAQMQARAAIQADEGDDS